MPDAVPGNSRRETVIGGGGSGGGQAGVRPITASPKENNTEVQVRSRYRTVSEYVPDRSYKQQAVARQEVAYLDL